MKYLFLFTLLCTGFFANAQNYPATKKTPTAVTKHGISYVDDYTWLELQDKDAATWVDAQNKLFASHLEEINTQKAITKKIKEYDAGSSYALPVKREKYYYIMVRMNPGKPPQLHYMDKPDGALKPLPNPLSDDDSKAFVINYYPSVNSAYLAFSISPNGGDKHDVKFLDMKKNRFEDDVLTGIKYSGIRWKNDEGIFYKHNINKTAFAADSTYQLYYHVIGKPQKEDKLIFDSSAANSHFSFGVNDEYLFITEEINNGNNKNYYRLHLDSLSGSPVRFISNVEADFDFKYYYKGRFYYSTQQYDWGEFRSRNLDGTDEKVVIPQFYNQLLTSTLLFSDFVVCKYKTPGKYHLSVYDKDIHFIRKYDLPPGMDCKVYFYNEENNCLYMSLSSYTLSPQNYTLNLQTGEFKPFYSATFKPKPTLFPLDHFESKTVTYKSRDGKDVPITIVHKKGLAMDGNNPTLLKAYGGFGRISTPAYDTGLLYFLEQGGVFAYAEVRGGGEKGLKWHAGGQGRSKINAINDVVDAAEFLIAERYTSPARLAFTGASHGGLLATGAMTQRPELFKVIISEMGVTDVPSAMQYTVGNYHKDEFGDTAVKEDYESMLTYSPYQKIKEDVNYPVTLLITGENDDRVPPFQSYKFAAKLQNRTVQKNPVYIKTSGSGHNKSPNYDERTKNAAEFYSFLLYHLMK
ncbi:prolyl oligopeptidase family serine peptidase [Flavobacterium sp. DGU11]|uniref:prolyl oligopeptidase n=1 Tax=Flavobacterium arundinis TaxID=3139143 RepID=A0ABU9I2F0_9FLAO